MNLGNLKKSIFYLFIFFFIFKSAFSEDIQVTPLINLEDVSPTFEEDKQILEQEEIIEKKTYKKKKKNKSQNIDEKIYVNLKALDKITAKTSSIKIAIGERKRFGKLEIIPLKCSLNDSGRVDDNIAYIQVRDLFSRDNNQVFIFNGWMFSSSPTIRFIDHPVYDLWLINCENI